jgi:hypothetical protein
MSAFSGEITHPEYEYLYEITEQKDVDIVFNTIKQWISKYSNYNCSIRNAEEGATNLFILAIKKVPMNIGPENDVAHCQLYFNGKRIDLFLSKAEILGLTQAYKPNEAENVFNRVYSLFLNNIRSNSR